MCCTCDANFVLESTSHNEVARFKWEATPELALEVEGKGEGPEGKPARFRVRRIGENWSKWLRTNDLAASMMTLGTDVRWELVAEPVKNWLLSGDFSPVEQLLEAEL